MKTGESEGSYFTALEMGQQVKQHTNLLQFPQLPCAELVVVSDTYISTVRQSEEFPGGDRAHLAHALGTVAPWNPAMLSPALLYTYGPG